MPTRRGLIVGASLLGVAGAAQALIPRRRTSLLGDRKIDELIPRSFPGWSATSNLNIIAPSPKGSLADRLYSQQSQRVYSDAAGNLVMMLIAYGNTQSDQLQLHRPEVCYPAVGFTISRTGTSTVPLGPDKSIPVRELSAQLDQRNEQILYWTRLGEALPLTGGEQRRVRLNNALHGIVSDGVLVRVSTLGAAFDSGSRINHDFTRAFVMHAAPTLRRALLGSAYTNLGRA